MKKSIAIMLALLMAVTAVFAQSVSEAKTDELGRFSLGMKTNGFTVTNISDFEMIGADIIEFRHDKTGAIVLLALNEDTNRAFEITFRTPTEDDTGIPHVFEHATISGSKKYPSADLFFNLVYQTYHTDMNAHTYSSMTSYPISSLSEDQLLALSDYYTDSVFNQLVLEDKSIFDREAWRYVLESPEDDLTIAGTVYSEMLGAITRQRKATKNVDSIAFPGSFIVNDSGGNPDAIPDMTWENLVEYHDKYYHPSNSLTTIYGKIDRWADFLGMLDSYFSAYQYRAFNIVDAGYQPITGPVQKFFEFPVESGSDTQHSSTVYYDFICKDVDQETLNKIDLMVVLANDSSSVLIENLKNALPYGSFACSLDFSGPEAAIQFVADNINAEDTELFKSIVDSSMAQIASEGFDPVAVDSIASAYEMDILLSGDNPNNGVSIMPNIAYYWATLDLLYGFQDYVKSVSNFNKWNDEGAFKEIIRKYIVDNNLHALATTTAVAGLKEQKDAALAEHLAQVKASMSDAQIDTIVKATNAPKQENPETAAMVKQIQVVDVQSLPEETRIYDIEDKTESDGIRRIWAKADVSGVGYAGLLFDASGLRQDQIHYFNFFTYLIKELDTERHSRAELSSLLARYLFNGTIGVSIMEDEITKAFNPCLRVGFYTKDEDVSSAMDLVHEMLFERVFDIARITEAATRLRTTLKQLITDSSRDIMLSRARARASLSYAYYSYINHLDYYYFMDGVLSALETDPDSVVRNLKEIVQYFNNSTNTIVYFAGNKESYDNYLPIAEAFMATLDRRPIERQNYNLPMPADREAMIVDSSVNYNYIFATNEELGYDKMPGDLKAVMNLVNDMYLMPELRDLRGAYGAYIQSTDYGVFAYTYRDPNIESTFEVYKGLADFIANIEIDQDTLDGYILSAYSNYALGSGELSGAVTAISNHIQNMDPSRIISLMRDLKALKADTFAETYAPFFQALLDNCTYYTSGGASAINAVADLYDVILNPFGVVDRSQITLSDLTGEGPFDEAVRFCFFNGLMTAQSDSAFGAADPATLGESAQVLAKLAFGAELPADQAIASLAQYGIVPMSEPSTILTVEELDSISCKFLALAAHLDLDELIVSELKALGIDPSSAATRGILAQVVYAMLN